MSMFDNLPSTVPEGKNRFRITVQTTDIRNAGTGATVYIKLFSGSKMVGPIDLRKPGIRSFERGERDVFTCDLPELGELTSIEFGHDSKGLVANYHLDWVSVENLTTRKACKFIHRKWIPAPDSNVPSATLQPAETYDLTPLVDAPLPTVNSDVPLEHRDKHRYRIVVGTTDVLGAGTDAKVYITMKSSSGEQLGPYHLTERGKNNFESGDVDTFFFDLPGITDIQEIVFGHDNTGPGPRHHLAYVNIYDETTKRLWRFKYNGWIPAVKGGSTYVTLTPSEVLDGPTNSTVQPQGRSPLEHVDLEAAKALSMKAEWAAEEEELKRKQEAEEQERKWLEEERQRQEARAREEAEAKARAAAAALKAVEPEPSHLYRIAIKTSDIPGAGTHEPITLSLIGANGVRSKEYRLGSSEDEFEQDTTAEFTIGMAREIPDLESVDIGFAPNASDAARWHLSHVLVTYEYTGAQFFFPLSDWLSVNSGRRRVLLRKTWENDPSKMAKTPSRAKQGLRAFSPDTRTADKMYARQVRSSQTSRPRTAGARSSYGALGQSIVPIGRVGEGFMKSTSSFGRTSLSNFKSSGAYSFGLRTEREQASKVFLGSKFVRHERREDIASIPPPGAYFQMDKGALGPQTLSTHLSSPSTNFGLKASRRFEDVNLAIKRSIATPPVGSYFDGIEQATALSISHRPGSRASPSAVFGKTTRDKDSRLFLGHSAIAHTNKGTATEKLTTKLDGAFSGFSKQTESLSRTAPSASFGMSTGRAYHVERELTMRSSTPGPGYYA